MTAVAVSPFQVSDCALEVNLWAVSVNLWAPLLRLLPELANRIKSFKLLVVEVTRCQVQMLALLRLEHWLAFYCSSAIIS